MITRIELKNFMSHEQTVIEPAAGLTVLVGPNNCGKSAVVAALQILCRNDKSTYVMRHGEKECSVQVETDDGHVIQWRRKGSPSYLIDGNLFDRLQQSGIPPQLHQALRLPIVDGGNNTEFDIHFGIQKEPIFLLRNSAENAKFFASSSDAIRLVEMQKRHKDKLADARGEKNRLEAEAKQLTAELESLEPAVELEQQIKQAEQFYAWIHEQQEEMQAAEELASDLATRAQVVARHQAEVQSLRGLAAPPELAATEPLARLMEQLTTGQQGCAIAKARVEALAPLPLPPPQHDVAALAQLLDRLHHWQSGVERSSASQAATAPLESPPVLADEQAVAKVVQRLEFAAKELAANHAWSEQLGSLPPPPAIDDVSQLEMLISKLSPTLKEVDKQQAQAAAMAALTIIPPPVETAALAEFVVRLESTERSVAACRETLAQSEADLAATEEQVRQAASGSVCAACGSPLDPDRVLAHAAAGLGGHAHD